ncbi:MAG: phosphotransferase [Gammaproteobacteria bacterium]|nr:phosphotransferase [Gammaproteobacteria bacterium]
MPDRSTLLNQWLEQLGYRDYRLSAASEDASFRSYLRLECGADSFVIMDAPPQQEPCDRFIAIAHKLRDAGLNAPEIIASNLADGFLLLTDFGSTDYLSQLDAQTEGPLYADALAALLAMQAGIDADDLPDYDEALLQREMDLFHDWFMLKLLGVELDASQRATWQGIKQLLVENALAQPRVFVHRDYHSRNLMKLERHNPGILDFQDAVRGPVTYDLVSLLRDCYVAWPAARVDQLVQDYHQSVRANGLVDVEVAQFRRWFDLMGVQRHLKAVGIFSRLNIRDGKPGYLKDIPRTLGYLRQASADEASIAGLAALIEQLQLHQSIDALVRG